MTKTKKTLRKCKKFDFENCRDTDPSQRRQLENGCDIISFILCFRFDKHKHLCHWFVSMALIYEYKFLSYPSRPLIDLEQLKPEHIILSVSEYARIRSHAIALVLNIITDHFLQLAHLRPKKTKSEEKLKKTKIVRLPALPYNESKYQDVVKILGSYENLTRDLYEKADETRQDVQIGGDQLTRERFSGSKNLRIGNDEADSFARLTPVSFEFFHLQMNFLEKIIFRRLYDADSDLEQGTMRSEANRIHRFGIDPNVIKAYEADRDFFESFYRAYVVEGFRHYLNLEDTNDVPDGVPGPGCSQNEKDRWIEANIGSYVDQEVLPAWSGRSVQAQTCEGNYTYPNHWQNFAVESGGEQINSLSSAGQP